MHVFYHCNKIKEFRSSLQNWLQNNCNISFDLTVQNFIFSGQTENSLLNYLLLLARKVIFYLNNIRFETYLCYVKRKYQNEKYISKLHDEQDKFNAKWSESCFEQ